MFDVCSVPSRDKCRKFRGRPSWDELSPLVELWVGVRGLIMKLSKILYYLGSECVRRKHFKDVDPEKFEFILEFEMVHALCCALFVDYRQGQVWILEESAIELLENHSQAPETLTAGWCHCHPPPCTGVSPGARLIHGVLMGAPRLLQPGSRSLDCARQVSLFHQGE